MNDHEIYINKILLTSNKYIKLIEFYWVITINYILLMSNYLYLSLQSCICDLDFYFHHVGRLVMW